MVRVGTSLTLTCHVDSQRDIAFAWVVGGATYNQSTGRFVISSTPTQSTLTLVTVEEGDLGNVTCVARDPIHLPISTNSLLTEDPAFYLYGNSDNRNFTLVDSDVFRLDCGVRGGGSDVKVHWFRNLLEVGSSGSEGFEIRTLPNGTSSLIRSMASLADDGNAYSCKAVYNRVSLTQRFNIFVTSEFGSEELCSLFTHTLARTHTHTHTCTSRTHTHTHARPHTHTHSPWEVHPASPCHH